MCGVQLDRKWVDVSFKRHEIQTIWLSIDVRFKWFWLSVDLNFKWCGCQLIWDSSDSALQLIWDSSGLVVSWSEIQVIWLSENKAFLQDFLKKNPLESSETKHFCGTSFKHETLKIKNEPFLRDFLQNWNCEAQKTKPFCETSFKNRNFETPKPSISARLPSKMKLGRSRTKLFCETSFKIEALKLAFLRDFLQKRSFEDQKRSFSARLPSTLKLWSSKTKRFCETSFKIDMLSRHLTSEFQYVLVIFMWMLQKYCACHEKVAPRHTKSCNCHAKWSLQSNTSVTWNLQPFHGFSVGGFKHRHHRARNHCACHAKRIVPDPLQIHHACQRFCNPHELLRLPRILQRVEIPAPATRNTLWTSKNVLRPSVFNDFDFQIALARRRGANFAKLNFQKCSEPLSF